MMKEEKLLIKKLAVFASGAGSNAAKIIEYFQQPGKVAQVVLIVTNNSNAGVINIAAENFIECIIITKQQFYNGDAYLPVLQNAGIDLLILAGFLWKIPATLLKAYPEKIINIHPALLPKYGGKGMYGNFVHEAVIAASETESGITIHIADEVYDNGRQLFQITCPVYTNDTPQTLAQRIHVLEHKYFPKIIEQYIDSLPV